MTAMAVDAVIHLHQYLESWLKGEIGEPGSEPLRLAEALAPGFKVIHPTGVMENRQAVLKHFHLAHGSRGKRFRIQVGDFVTHVVRDDLTVISYTESHRGEQRNHRRSTAVLVVGDDHATRWQLLHETRLPSP